MSLQRPNNQDKFYPFSELLMIKEYGQSQD